MILFQHAKRTLPEFVPPPKASSVKEPFDSPDWVFEIKLDGYRAIAVFDVKPIQSNRTGNKSFRAWD